VEKKGSIILLLILISGVAILIFSIQRGSRNIYSDPYKAIPEDAFLILESVDLPELLNSFSEGNGLFKEMASVREMDQFCKKLRYLTALLNRKEWKKLFGNNTSLISFQPDNRGKIVPLLSMNVPPNIRSRDIREILNSTVKGTLSEKKAGAEKIIHISYNAVNQNDTVCVSFISGLLICSFSEDLIKQAIKQKDLKNDIRLVPGFSRILAASGKKEDKIFIVFKNISAVIKSLTGGKASGLAEKISRLAGSAEGDIFLNEEGFVLSGYTESADTADYLNKYKSCPPGSLDTYKILPSATVLFETTLLPLRSKGEPGNTHVSDSTRTLAVRLAPYIGEEVTRAIIDIKDNQVNKNSIVIYELRNRGEVERLFYETIGTWSKKLQLTEKNYIQYFQPDEQTKIPVFSTPFKGLISVILPGFAPESEDSLFAFYDNYMITGNSYNTISRFLYDNLLNKTLANDMLYRDFSGSLPSRAGYFFYCVPSGIVDYLSGFLNDEIINSLKHNINSLRKIQACGYQFTASNGMIYNTLSLNFKEQVREETGTEWETLLDTAACIKPFFFTNHNTGAKEIFIQDYKNSAYLINAAGRVLWKVALSEKIIGNVFMIDYYKNGKYQLLFSGKNNLHLLDRNGNYVERYPVKLRSPGSGPLALFDYDNNKDYRLIIPGEDKLIYAYDISGNVVKGWKPFRTNGVVRSEAKFFRISGKDYLIASDENTIYFLDRTGNVKLRLKDPVTRARGSEIRFIQGSDPELVLSAPDGALQFVSFDGTVRKTTFKKFSGDHSFDFFDVNGDGFGEYLFIDSGILYLYNHNKSEIFTRNFNSDELEGPIYFVFSASEREIGVFDNRKKLIYLIDKNGNTMDGFPLRGASMFSIGKLSEKSGFHLIVGGDDNFLYNYKLNTDSK
jgi:hypothetical protein